MCVGVFVVGVCGGVCVYVSGFFVFVCVWWLCMFCACCEFVCVVCCVVFVYMCVWCLCVGGFGCGLGVFVVWCVCVGCVWYALSLWCGLCVCVCGVRVLFACVWIVCVRVVCLCVGCGVCGYVYGVLCVR